MDRKGKEGMWRNFIGVSWGGDEALIDRWCAVVTVSAKVNWERDDDRFSRRRVGFSRKVMCTCTKSKPWHHWNNSARGRSALTKLRSDWSLYQVGTLNGTS